MSLYRDYLNETEGYSLTSKLESFLSPALWLRLHKWRKQRADRGWSDRDAWGAGEHIADMTAQMLVYLRDKGVTDWESWFKYNISDKSNYTELQPVIDDITNYLNFSQTSWADDLTSTSNPVGRFHIGLLDHDGEALTEDEILKRIQKHSKEEQRLYKRATRAMQFFGKNFANFWD